MDDAGGAVGVEVSHRGGHITCPRHQLYLRFRPQGVGREIGQPVGVSGAYARTSERPLDFSGEPSLIDKVVQTLDGERDASRL